MARVMVVIMMAVAVEHDDGDDDDGHGATDEADDGSGWPADICDPRGPGRGSPWVRPGCPRKKLRAQREEPPRDAVMMEMVVMMGDGGDDDDGDNGQWQ